MTPKVESRLGTTASFIGAEGVGAVTSTGGVSEAVANALMATGESMSRTAAMVGATGPSRSEGAVGGEAPRRHWPVRPARGLHLASHAHVVQDRRES